MARGGGMAAVDGGIVLLNGRRRTRPPIASSRIPCTRHTTRPATARARTIDHAPAQDRLTEGRLLPTRSALVAGASFYVLLQSHALNTGVGAHAPLRNRCSFLNTDSSSQLYTKYVVFFLSTGYLQAACLALRTPRILCCMHTQDKSKATT